MNCFMKVLAFFCMVSACLSPGYLHAAGLSSVGVSVADLGNPFFLRIAQSVTRKAKALTGKPVKVIVRSSAYDLDRQKEQIDEFIRLKVDLIVLTAADSLKIEPYVRKAQKAGIYVIAVDINAAGADLTITTDNVQAGEIACDYLAQQLNGKGNIVIINGAVISSVTDRVDGCKSCLKKYPGITLLSDNLNGGGSVEGGLEVMTYLINAYDKIDGVFAINDPSAKGAVTAAKQAGRNNFLIVSVDGSPVARQALAGQDSPWIASAAQSPRQMAEQAVQIGLMLLQDRTIASNIILIPAKLITRENLNEIKGWDYQP